MPATYPALLVICFSLGSSAVLCLPKTGRRQVTFSTISYNAATFPPFLSVTTFFFFCRVYVSCDLCFEWFHPECLEMSEDNIAGLHDIETFFCPSCSQHKDVVTTVTMRIYTRAHAVHVEVSSSLCNRASYVTDISMPLSPDHLPIQCCVV